MSQNTLDLHLSSLCLIRLCISMFQLFRFVYRENSTHKKLKKPRRRLQRQSSESGIDFGFILHCLLNVAHEWC